MAKQVFFKVYLSNSICKTVTKVFRDADGSSRPPIISQIKQRVLEDIGCEEENAKDFSLLNLTAEHALAPVSGQFVFEDKDVFIMSKSVQLHEPLNHATCTCNV